jgi:hypothetical protein
MAFFFVHFHRNRVGQGGEQGETQSKAVRNLGATACTKLAVAVHFRYRTIRHGRGVRGDYRQYIVRSTKTRFTPLYGLFFSRVEQEQHRRTAHRLPACDGRSSENLGFDVDLGFVHCGAAVDFDPGVFKGVGHRFHGGFFGEPTFLERIVVRDDGGFAPQSACGTGDDICRGIRIAVFASVGEKPADTAAGNDLSPVFNLFCLRYGDGDRVGDRFVF